MNQKYYNAFQTRWVRADFHIRGCMLEGMIGEFERGFLDEETFLECLRMIASGMK